MLYASQLSEYVWQLYCEGCGKPTDVVSGDCVVWHLRKQILGSPMGRCFCFDCDGGADEVPQSLDGDGYNNVVVFDGKEVTTVYQEPKLLV